MSIYGSNRSNRLFNHQIRVFVIIMQRDVDPIDTLLSLCFCSKLNRPRAT